MGLGLFSLGPPQLHLAQPFTSCLSSNAVELPDVLGMGGTRGDRVGLPRLPPERGP
jgi:hypothetical protein